MQCPACGHDAAQVDFGTPAQCPACDAFYEKALAARAKRVEIEIEKEAKAEKANRSAASRERSQSIVRKVAEFAGLAVKPGRTHVSRMTVAWLAAIAAAAVVIVQALLPKPVVPRAAPPSTVANAAQEYTGTPLQVPSDPGGRYFVLGLSGGKDERTIITKRVGSSGTSYSKRLYRCSDFTTKYLGTGETFDEMEISRPDPHMTLVVSGSIAAFVGRAACR
ncbi:hypothetical protein D9M70_431680 [compost metagenome]